MSAPAVPGAPPALPPLHNTIGAFFIADMLAGVLLGGLFVQMWMYYNTFPTDAWTNKVLVGFVFLTNLLHQALICHPLYEITITHYADPSFLQSFPWSFIAMSWVNALIAFTIQLWYIFRIWRLSKNNFFIAVPLATISIAQFTVNTILVPVASNLKDFTEVVKVEPYIKSFTCIGAGIDALIAIAMSLLLNQSRTGFKRTDNVITKLTLYCANTGILTGGFAILTVVLLVACPGTQINFPPYFSLPRVYGISFMAILNARTSLTGSSSRGDDVSMSLQSRSRPFRKEMGQPSTGAGVAINISQTVMHDEEAASEHTLHGKKNTDYL